MKKINTKEQARQSRINDAKTFLQKNNGSSLLSNTKWHKIFETIELGTVKFRIKLLTDHFEGIENDWNTSVIELETNTILTDNYNNYGFIEFFEIEYLDILKGDGQEIPALNVKSDKFDGYVRIYGYIL